MEPMGTATTTTATAATNAATLPSKQILEEFFLHRLAEHRRDEWAPQSILAAAQFGKALNILRYAAI